MVLFDVDVLFHNLYFLDIDCRHLCEDRYMPKSTDNSGHTLLLQGHETRQVWAGDISRRLERCIPAPRGVQMKGNQCTDSN